MLLEEYNEVETFDVITEDNNGEKTYKMRGAFGKCDVPNKNKRIYWRSIMEDAINEVRDLIGKKGFVGQLDHPNSPKIEVEKISHYMTDLNIAEDGTIVGELTPTSSWHGQQLKAHLRDGLRLGVSTRGTGSLKQHNGKLGEGLLEVQPGYRMKAIDVVFDPSAGSYPEQVAESTEEEEERKIILASPSNFKEIFEEVFSRK